MGTWKAKWPVEYSAASDENIDSWVQKYIAEIDRIYQLLHRVRVQDAAAGEPDDTVPYQWHFETLTNTLFIRNPADAAWVPVGHFNADQTRFVYDRVVSNAGGVESLAMGTAEPPSEGMSANDVYLQLPTTDADGWVYRYSSERSTWVKLYPLLRKSEDGKLIGNLAGKADEAAHADAAAARATEAKEAELAQRATRLATPVRINGIEFDGSRSINISAGGSGATTESFQQLLWRMNQNERELSNIELKLADEGIYPDYNNLLTENFKNGAEDLDETAVKVTSLAAGDDSMDVEDLSQLKVGNVYTLTDGDQQEQVRIKAMARKGATNRVVLAEKTGKVYEGTPMLVRTTAEFSSVCAMTKKDNKTLECDAMDTWTGESSSSSSTVVMKSSLGDASLFTQSGDTAFTSDGYLSLDISIKHRHAIGIALVKTGDRVGTWARVDGDGNDYEEA